jgi:toxin YoeB
LANWRIVFSKRAEKDWKIILKSEYKTKVIDLLNLLERDPFQEPPPVKQLQGDLSGAYSRRINQQHRLVYRLDKSKQIVNIIMMWLHYE